MNIINSRSFEVPGQIIMCPICGYPLNNAGMGINSHLRKHVRNGEAAEKDLQAIRASLQPSMRARFGKNDAHDADNTAVGS